MAASQVLFVLDASLHCPRASWARRRRRGPHLIDARQVVGARPAAVVCLARSVVQDVFLIDRRQMLPHSAPTTFDGRR